MSLTPNMTEFKIVKFDRPTNNSVKVVACARMDDLWFDSGINLVRDLAMKVHAAYEKFAV